RRQAAARPARISSPGAERSATLWCPICSRRPEPVRHGARLSQVTEAAARFAMRRRDVVVGAGAAAGMSLGLARPSIAQGVRRLRMVTDWPDGPGMLSSARRLAETIAAASDGRIEIEVSPSGAVVRPFETFDAVE